MSNEMTIGKHLLRWEDDEFVLLVQDGPMNGEEAVRIMEEMEKRYVTKTTYLLCDNRKAGGMSVEARKAFGRATGAMNGRQMFIAIFGGSFSFRVIVNLVMKALAMTGQKIHTVASVDEAGARAWLLENKSKVEQGELNTAAT